MFFSVVPWPLTLLFGILLKKCSDWSMKVCFPPFLQYLTDQQTGTRAHREALPKIAVFYSRIVLRFNIHINIYISF